MDLSSDVFIPSGGRCPAYDDPNHPILLADPTNCRQYYSCFFGQLRLQHCPPNMYWSETNYRCDYKQYSTCNNEESSQVQYTPYPGDCSRFYETKVQQCPGNLHWSSSYRRCVDPLYSGCGALPWDSSPSEVIPSPGGGPITNPGYLPIDPQELCINSALNTYIPYPGDCQKFIHCDSRATVLVCPGDLYWNPQKVSCGTDRTYCQVF
ncbi:uncharacterized protein Dana_GF24496 [Drosophila ananassae]|uniref:Chitin-binding type-2 domain-containing protein n=1 Tax=Drosophila ananassae TaxID=7217 RepID=B3M4M9_DROAN|nr:uncharacterized protein Dana_GF24496 [Drosophila ananassae]